MTAWPDWLRQLADNHRKLGTPESRDMFTDGTRRWRQEQSALGLCTCGAPLAPSSTTMCSTCLTKQAFRIEDRYERLKRKGMCTTCGTKKSVRGQLCRTCSDQHNADSKRAREELKSAGLCISCKDDAAPNSVRCEACKAVESKQANNRNHARREHGLCATCGLVQSTTWNCESCRAKIRARRNRGNEPLDAQIAAAIVGAIFTPQQIDNVREPLIAAAATKIAKAHEDMVRTGIVVIDEEYLLARELVMKKAV